LETLRAGLATRGTTGLLVRRGDETLLEWYADGWSASRPHYTASLAKALVGGLSLILALQDGRIGVDDAASRYVAQWRGDPQKEVLTVRHLATHTSGLSDADYVAEPDWMRRFWKRDEPDPFTVARDDAPMLFAPGTGNAYSNPGIAMLGYCVTAALRDAPQPDIRTLLRERVFDPIGLALGEWSIGYSQTYVVDGLPLVGNWGGGSFTARVIARVGQLMLQGGAWDGRQLLGQETVTQALTYAGMLVPRRSEKELAPASGLCWYVNHDGVWPGVPRDAFAGGGAGHQLLLVAPSERLIVVRQGEHLEGDPQRGFWGPAYRHLFAPLVAALDA